MICETWIPNRLDSFSRQVDCQAPQAYVCGHMTLGHNAPQEEAIAI